MDLEKVLKFQEELFPLETDSDLNVKILPSFKMEEDWHHPEALESGVNSEDLVGDIEELFDIATTPMNDMAEYAQSKQVLAPHELCSLYRNLKKKKMILKRQRAKKRRVENSKSQPAPQQVFSQFKFESMISEEELKRKKNRISAQISRDKKRQYFNKLIEENQTLRIDNMRLETENGELRKIIQSLTGHLPGCETRAFHKPPLKKSQRAKKKKEVYEHPIPLRRKHY